MNIIEAFQKAENGSLITNCFLKKVNHFLKYVGEGHFWEYELIDDKPIYKYDFTDFVFAEILTISWEVLDKNYFEELKK